MARNSSVGVKPHLPVLNCNCNGKRHSKNAGVMGSEALTYHEKKYLGYGTVSERISKESQGNYNDCRLTLQPAVDPVCSPSGYIYSRDAIIECLAEQKKAARRKLASWEAQQEDEQRQEQEKSELEAKARLVAFERQNNAGASDHTVNALQSALKEAADHMHDGRYAKNVVAIQENKERMKELKSFWHPSQTPELKKKLDKPSLDTVCPASGKKLKLRDLVPVQFTPVPGEAGAYMDPVTRKTFTNSSRLVVLRESGTVMLEETFQKIVKPEGHYNGSKISSKKDVIKLEKGGTGFAAHDGDKVESKRFWHLGPGNGLADLRGQHQGPRSHGGLIFYN